MVEISGLFIYPVKSCRAISVDEVEVGQRGFLHDREFLVVDGVDAFLTQREVPELATVRTALQDGQLLLSVPNAGELRVALDASYARNDATRSVTIFRDQVLADDVGSEAAEWFSDVLQRKCRLVRIGPASSRKVSNEKLAERHRDSMSADISFTDAFPTLLTSEASLDDLNSRLSEPLPMDRFRPNVVVKGARPFEEDTWSRIAIGRIAFECSAACLRCVITTTDQHSGARMGPEPLRTLATYRRAPDRDGVMFGQYLVHSTTGRLRVGDGLASER